MKIAFILCPIVLCTAATAQSTWYVDAAAAPPGVGSLAAPYSSIQYAIDQSTTVSGDTLLVADGTYVESLRFWGKSLALRSVNGAANTTIQGGINPHAAIRWVDGEGAGTLLEGFTVRDARNVSSPGGGFACSAGSGTVQDCVFIACGSTSAGGGGASVSSGASVRFENVVVRDCFSFVRGGGIDVDSSNAAVMSCVIENCSAAFSGSSGLGGGLNGHASVIEVDNTQVLGNLSDGVCGGFSASQCSVWIHGSRFVANIADARGAGIHLLDSAATIVECWIERNSTFFGGGGPIGHGLYSNRRDATQVRSTTFLQNGSAGAGLSQAAVVGATLERCTLARNFTNSFLDTAAARDCVLNNCVVWGNVPTANSLTACVVRYSDVEGGASGVGNIDFDPLFVDLAGDDLRLLPGSPCIDSGDPTSLPDADGTRADMGAFP